MWKDDWDGRGTGSDTQYISMATTSMQTIAVLVRIQLTEKKQRDKSYYSEEIQGSSQKKIKEGVVLRSKHICDRIREKRPNRRFGQNKFFSGKGIYEVQVLPTQNMSYDSKFIINSFFNV